MLCVHTGKYAWIRELCCVCTQVNMLTSSMATSPQSENYAALNVLESENYAECVHTGKYARIIDGHFATVRELCCIKCAWIRELCCVCTQVNMLESENNAECVHTGKYARIIDGHFATVRAGQRTEKKVTIKTLKEPLSGGHDALFVCWSTLYSDFVSFLCIVVVYISKHKRFKQTLTYFNTDTQ